MTNRTKKQNKHRITKQNNAPVQEPGIDKLILVLGGNLERLTSPNIPIIINMQTYIY